MKRSEVLNRHSPPNGWLGKERSFASYVDLLQKWGAVHNLSTVLSTEDVVTKHFLDCAKALETWSPARGQTVFDFGSGAGFPGVVWAILDPSLKVTAVERSRKKCSFLRILKSNLRLDSLEIHNGDALNLALEPDDWVTSRATFSSLDSLAHTVANLALLLGPSAKEDEVRRLFNGRRVDWKKYVIPDGDRVLALIYD